MIFTMAIQKLEQTTRDFVARYLRGCQQASHGFNQRLAED